MCLLLIFVFVFVLFSVSQWMYQDVFFFTFKRNISRYHRFVHSLDCFNVGFLAAERFKSDSSRCWALNVIFVSFVIRIPPNGNKCSASILFFILRSSAWIGFNCVKYFNCREKKCNKHKNCVCVFLCISSSHLKEALKYLTSFRLKRACV